MPVVFQHHESWYGTWLSTMARKARVSVYKVFWLGGCFPSDILAAIDRAILDGVNVLSLSLGGKSSDFYRDNLAIGAFAATEKGIDRDFPAYVSLGNGKNYSGVSLYNGSSLTGTLLPFVYAANASKNTTGNFCIAGTLDPEKVAGKIILCDRGMTLNVEKGQVVKQAGGAGMVLANTAESGEELVAEAHLLPATSVSEKMGSEIKKYLLSDPNPTVTIIFEGTKVGIQPAPVVSAFSSRGPSKVAPSILKPDMIAPGVNILAGWTGAASPTGLPIDSRRPRRVQHYLWDLHVLPPT
ncbi:hypothetical protein SAY86_017812 [Trapa natans]|uniref:Uncharacterized protein n=1 Tax=Trapa natans TaxID=22666 RepID=A0AAN7M2E7_TRANT|nr:hypothetical protein SAY86_017812 [Trapa natans]